MAHDTSNPVSTVPVRSAEQMGFTADRFLAWVDRHRHALWCGLIVLHLLAFSGRWRIGPDTSIYVSLGRHLAAGEGFQTVDWPWGKTHIGLPLLLAISFRIFGPDVYLPALVATYVAGIAALLLVYHALQFNVSRAEAAVVTLLVGISFTFTEYLYELLTDIPAFLGVAAALAAFEVLTHPSARTGTGPRVFWIFVLLAGLLLAAFMRPVGWVLALLIMVVFAHRMLSGRGRWVATLATAAIVVAALLYTLNPEHGATGYGYLPWMCRWFRSVVSQSSGARIGQSFNLIFGTLTVQTFFTCGMGPIISNVAAVGLLTVTFWVCRRNMLWQLWLVATLVLLLAYPEPQTRYYLPVLPLLALGYWRLAEYCGRQTRGRLWITLLLALWIIPSMARLGRLAYLQHASPFLEHVTNGRYVPVAQMAALVHKHVPSDALIVSQEALALDAFDHSRHYVLLINGELPPDVQPQLAALARAGKLYAVDADVGGLSLILDRAGVLEGKPIVTVERQPWDLPRIPGRWFMPQPFPALPPLVLRQVSEKFP